MNPIARISLILPLIAGALLLSSCASSYNKAFDQSAAEYSAGKVKSPEGAWEGTWTTSTNGHTGPIRAIVSEDLDKPGHYDFKYRASWNNFFSGTFNVNYAAKRRGGSYLVNGSEDLGPFGEFQHDAIITPSRFSASYKKNGGEEIGAFQMKRPAKQ